MELLTDTEIGERIKALREQAGERQADLGATLGLDQTAISKIEAGTRTLSGRELALLAAHFGVTTSALVAREEAALKLRVGEASPEAVKDGFRTFHRFVDGYFGALALAGER